MGAESGGGVGLEARRPTPGGREEVRELGEELGERQAGTGNGSTKSDSGQSGQPWGGEMGTVLPRRLKRDIQGPCTCLCMLISLPCLGPSHRTTGRSFKGQANHACVPLGTQYFA